MSTEKINGERVSNKDLYETLKDFPTRRELRMTLALGLIGGQTVASLVTAYITHLSPPQQALAIFHVFF